MVGHYGGQCDAGGLRGENHSHLIHIEVFAKLHGNMFHEFRINAVVQKTIHLNNVAGQNLALFYNALPQLLHGKLPLSFLSFQVCLCR